MQYIVTIDSVCDDNTQPVNRQAKIKTLWATIVIKENWAYYVEK